MRFTIRELILLVTIVCISLAWWGERRARAAAVKEMSDAVADAKSLAHFSALFGMPNGGMTFRTQTYYYQLQVKYGAHAPPEWKSWSPK